MNELEIIASRAAHAGVPFLLAGGHAVKHGHPGRIVKDAEDVIQLIQKNGLEREAEAIRELFQKHGTPEFYEKVRKACQRG